MPPTPLASLWLPILLSAVAIFLVSFLVHMVSKHHSTDFGKIPNEDAVMSAIGSNTAAGEYMFPWAGGMEAMKDPAFIEKRKRGPVGLIRVFPPSDGGFGKNLAMWFVYSLIICVFAAYLAGRAWRPGTEGSEIFRYIATTTWLAFGMGMAHESVWYNRPWKTTIKYLVDALFYSAAAGAVFVWLWPK